MAHTRCEEMHMIEHVPAAMQRACEIEESKDIENNVVVVEH